MAQVIYSEHTTGEVAEVCQAILNKFKHVDIDLLGMSCLALAITIQNEDIEANDLRAAVKIISEQIHLVAKSGETVN